MLLVSVHASCTTDTLCFYLSSQSPPCLMSPLPVGDQLTNGTYIGVGVGVGVFILIVVVIMVGLILVVVVRRKTVLEQNGDMMMDENPCYNKTAVMLDRTKKVLDHSHKPPPFGDDHYEIVDEGKKAASLSTVVYEEVDKQDTQTDRHPSHYQGLELTKMAGNEYASINA